VEVCAYAVMSNHLHVVLRIRPDIVEKWSDEFVVRRWGQLMLAQCKAMPDPPTDEQVQAALQDPDHVAELRRRLSCLSTFMGQLDEYIARTANAEDETTGHFWEGRFRCTRLLDEAALLACAVYVDLNPIRACMAKTPEDSRFTSIYDRILALRSNPSTVVLQHTDSLGAPADVDPEVTTGPADWLAPIRIEEVIAAAGDAAGTAEGTPRHRASDRGLLPLSLEDYIEIVEWTGRQQRADKPGAIPADLAPIFARLGLESEAWLKLTSQFTRMFTNAAGPIGLVKAAAERANKRWFQGARNSRASFRS
jgi:REP element-mobilizing transposase RayT